MHFHDSSRTFNLRFDGRPTLPTCMLISWYPATNIRIIGHAADYLQFFVFTRLYFYLSQSMRHFSNSQLGYINISK
jgi:hypothetical protein